jgi:hypothetical protein
MATRGRKNRGMNLIDEDLSSSRFFGSGSKTMRLKKEVAQPESNLTTECAANCNSGFAIEQSKFK